MNPLRDDGERFMPDSMFGVIALEHLHRYFFALQFVKDREVLDIACGEGYGSAILAKVGKRVIGVDIADAAVEHAQSRYGTGQLQFQQGTCAAIPLADKSVDVVVSFETLEHHDQHQEMLDECKRVLRDGGVLVISSPDKLEYSDRPGFANPFHVHELYADEFLGLLRTRFKHVRLLRQRVLAGSWLLQDGANPLVEFFNAAEPQEPTRQFPRAPFLVAVASDAEIPPIAAGVLEEDVTRLSSSVIREANKRATMLVRALAMPDSALLRESLNADWYLRTNQDLCSEDLDRYAHWINNGAEEGRLPAEDLITLAKGLIAENMASLPAASARSYAQFLQMAELMERQEALLRHAQNDREQGQLAQLQTLKDQLDKEAAAAAARESALRLDLANALEQVRDIRGMLANELELSSSERDSLRLEASTREATIMLQLEQAAARCESALKEQQLRFDAQASHEQALLGGRAALAEQRAAELMALLAAATAREHESHEQGLKLLQSAEQEKSSLRDRFAAKETALREQLAAVDALRREETAKLSDQLLHQEQQHAKELVQRGEAAAVAQREAHDQRLRLVQEAEQEKLILRGQLSDMASSLREQLANKDADHQKQIMSLSDALTQREQAFSTRSTQLMDAIAAAQLEATQARDFFARQEAALKDELERAKQALVDAATASRQQSQDAAAEHQRLSDEHAASTKILLERLGRIEASASWRWTAPLRALVRSQPEAPRDETSKGA